MFPLAHGSFWAILAKLNEIFTNNLSRSIEMNLQQYKMIKTFPFFLYIWKFGQRRHAEACLIWTTYGKKERRDGENIIQYLYLAARVDMNALRWFGHVERMDNERLLKKVMNAKVDGRSARGRPRFGWMDGVKRALNDRRMDIREASERARNRNDWRMIVTQFWLASAVKG